jgi:ketosteroid isomerase-like protein
VTRLGPWVPDGVEERLHRLEAIAEIRQLPARYALALDSRDLDALVALFVPDVRVGRDGSGRAALRAWFLAAMSEVRATVHVVANHVIGFESADVAHGIVYCRDEVEYPDTGEWRVGALQYDDDYRLVDGSWCIERRRFRRWYQVDALERPWPGRGIDGESDPIRTAALPDAFPTWAPFWDEVAVGRG